MFSFVSYLRGSSKSKATAQQQLQAGGAHEIPLSLEINIDAVEDEDEFMEITTRRKTYLEVAKEAFTKSPGMSLDGKNATINIRTKKQQQQQQQHLKQDLSDSAASLNDLDYVNYDLRKSNRHSLKLKNKRTPSQLKELKARKVHNAKKPASSSSTDYDLEV